MSNNINSWRNFHLFNSSFVSVHPHLHCYARQVHFYTCFGFTHVLGCSLSLILHNGKGFCNRMKQQDIELLITDGICSILEAKTEAGSCGISGSQSSLQFIFLNRMTVDASSFCFSIANAMLFLTCIICNTIILSIVYKNQVFGENCQARLLICNAAIIDLVSSLDCLTSAVGNIDNSIIRRYTAVCHIEAARRWLAKIIGHGSFFLLAVNRYYAVVKPFKGFVVFNRFMSFVYIFCLWGFSIFLVICIEITGKFKWHLSPDRTSVMIVASRVVRLTILTLVVTTASMTVIIYIKTLNHQRQIRRRIGHNDGVIRSNSCNGRRLSLVTQSIMLITGYYIISVIPLSVMLVLMEGLQKKVPVTCIRVGRLLFASNYANNAIVFFIMNRRFREVAREICCIRQC